MPPKHMQYKSQAILLLAQDLMGNAQTLQRKREAAGDVDPNDFDLPASRIFHLPLHVPLPAEYRQPTSRLIVLGHGDEDSTVIASKAEGGMQWDHLGLFNMLHTCLTVPGNMPSRVQRIVLHMCYGGGNRGDVPVKGSASKLAEFIVPPRTSFAQKFATIAGELTVDVTARTEETNMVAFVTPDQEFVNAQRQVAGRHQAEGDKIVFTTVAGSNPNNPQEATRQAVWKVAV